jgi:arabinose-5-phosphate isomerase
LRLGKRYNDQAFAQLPVISGVSTYQVASNVTKNTIGCNGASAPVNAPQTEIFVSQIIKQEAIAISQIPLDNPYEGVTELIYEHCQRRKGKLVITGVGKAGEIAKKLAVTFCSTGTVSVFMHPLEGLHGDLGLLQPNDLFLAISNSGKTREILEIIPLARKLISGIPLICLTGNNPSPLADMADFVLFTGPVLEVCPLGLTPTTSTTVMNVIGDIIVCLQMAKIEFGNHDYSLRHHGGYLGAAARLSKEAVNQSSQSPAPSQSPAQGPEPIPEPIEVYSNPNAGAIVRP